MNAGVSIKGRRKLPQMHFQDWPGYFATHEGGSAPPERVMTLPNSSCRGGKGARRAKGADVRIVWRGRELPQGADATGSGRTVRRRLLVTSEFLRGGYEMVRL